MGAQSDVVTVSSDSAAANPESTHLTFCIPIFFRLKEAAQRDLEYKSTGHRRR